MAEIEEKLAQVSKQKKDKAQPKSKQVESSNQQVAHQQVGAWKTRKTDKPVQSAYEMG